MTWTLQVLGPVRLARAGETPVRLGRKGEAALACLAAQCGAVPRSVLIDRLWADRDAGQARNALRQWLFQLRRTVGADIFAETGGEQVAIDGTRCEVDLWRFLECAGADEPARWTQAAMLYRGEFAQGLACADAWIETDRERVHLAAQGLLHRMGERAHEVDPEAALRLGRILLEQDSLHEGTYRALMRLYGHLGMRAKAMALWHECRHVLRLEVGAEPSRETREAYEQVAHGPDANAAAVVQPIRAVRGHAGSPPLIRDRDEARAIANDHHLLGMHLYCIGTPEGNARAREAFAKAATIMPDAADYAVASAWTYFTDFQFGWNGEPDRNFAHCLQLGQALMRRDPDHPLALALWGRLSLWQGDYRAAVDCFSATVRQRPDDTTMLSNAADAFMRAGRLNEALELVRGALEAGPDNRGVYHMVEGNILFGLGEFDGALAAFETALRRHPAMCAAHGGMAAVLAELGRVDAARDAARDAQSCGNLRLSLDFARGVMPFADPAQRHRWVRAWELAGVPQSDACSRQAAA